MIGNWRLCQASWILFKDLLSGGLGWIKCARTQIEIRGLWLVLIIVF